MKMLFTACTALLATGAFAGVRVETVTRDIKTKAPDGAVQTVLVQDGKMRTNTGRSGSMIIKNSTIYIINDQQKSYREMDKAQMQQMAGQASAAMAQMQERMKNMSPEQRAMMEKMMGGKVPGGMGTPGTADTWESKDTGKSDTVEGRKCRLWTLSRNGKLFEELCVVPFSSLPGKEDFEKTFKELAEAFSEMTKGMPNADEAVKARTAINGYPVRTRPYDASGKLRGTENVLTKWAEESIDAATFDVPKGYKKQAMPTMGGR
jgi:Domain of unknown function (DUF4412)